MRVCVWGGGVGWFRQREKHRDDKQIRMGSKKSNYKWRGFKGGSSMDYMTNA